jgi:hypothetical protein
MDRSMAPSLRRLLPNGFFTLFRMTKPPDCVILREQSDRRIHLIPIMAVRQHARKRYGAAAQRDAASAAKGYNRLR